MTASPSLSSSCGLTRRRSVRQFTGSISFNCTTKSISDVHLALHSTCLFFLSRWELTWTNAYNSVITHFSRQSRPRLVSLSLQGRLNEMAEATLHEAVLHPGPSAEQEDPPKHSSMQKLIENDLRSFLLNVTIPLLRSSVAFALSVGTVRFQKIRYSGDLASACRICEGTKYELPKSRNTKYRLCGVGSRA